MGRKMVRVREHARRAPCARPHEDDYEEEESDTERVRRMFLG